MTGSAVTVVGIGVAATEPLVVGSVWPSRLSLIAGPSSVHEMSVPTSGERKKFWAALTLVVLRPFNAVVDRNPSTGADAVIDA
jgi:hypothetical protein